MPKQTNRINPCFYIGLVASGFHRTRSYTPPKNPLQRVRAYRTQCCSLDSVRQRRLTSPLPPLTERGDEGLLRFQSPTQYIHRVLKRVYI